VDAALLAAKRMRGAGDLLSVEPDPRPALAGEPA
jgi:hypothetical protein